MTKNTKMLIGVAAVGVAAYLIYQQMNKPKGFVGDSRMSREMAINRFRKGR